MLKDPSQLKLLKKKKGPKYRNRKVTLDGRKWDSIAEAARYLQLLCLGDKGLISDLSIKPWYTFASGKISFYPDFSYFDCETKQQITEDVKGCPETAAFKIKAKLFEEAFGRKVKIVRMDSKTAAALVAAAKGQGR
jgi:hypothetical protein